MATKEIMWDRGVDRKTQRPLLNRRMWQIDPQTERTMHRIVEARQERSDSRGRRTAEHIGCFEEQWEIAQLENEAAREERITTSLGNR